MARSYHLKPHPSRPYDHQFHRPLKPAWIDRDWWFDSWRNFVWGSVFRGCDRFNRHNSWRHA